MRKSDGPAAGFTLVELLAVISIITILAALLLPVLDAALEQSRRIKCLGTQKQLYLALRIYADDSGVYPFHGRFNTWSNASGTNQEAYNSSSAAFRSCLGMNAFPKCPSMSNASTLYSSLPSSYWDWAQYFLFPGSVWPHYIQKPDYVYSGNVCYGGKTGGIPLDELYPFVSDPNLTTVSGGPGAAWYVLMHANSSQTMPMGANAVFKDGHGAFVPYNWGASSFGPISVLNRIGEHYFWGIYSNTIYPLPKR